jgi:predicted 3-demethylubiquinone-9 3-methyltransferase (glyoxalase superfamily)
MEKIIPFLWYNDQAEEAAKFYTSVFKNSKLGTLTRYGSDGPGPAGQVMTAVFELNGQEFIALNGGPQFRFTEAVSFVVNCETQEEIDYYWDRLSEGGEKSRCGWLKDKFGLSWQVVPAMMGKLFSDTDAEGSKRVMRAMMQMDKLDIAALKKAQGAPGDQ